MANKYTYAGKWSSKSYEKDIAVLHDEKYYRSEDETTPSDIPGISIRWTLIRHSIKEDAVSINDYDTFVSDPMAYDNGNSEGLYQFPNKDILASSVPINQRHFHKMGVQMMYQFAMAYYHANKETMPNITGVYIMQGDRKKNVITQGFSVAAVEAVGFRTTIETALSEAPQGTTFMRRLQQSVKLGTSKNDIAFPLISNDTKVSRFPVIQITRGVKTRSGSQVDLVWRMEEDAMSEMPVVRKEELTPDYTNIGYQVFKSSGGVLRKVFAAESMSKDSSDNTYIKNTTTNKFCVFTPDILLDRSMSVSTDLFVKPILKIRDEKITSLTEGADRETEDKMSAIGYRGVHDDENVVRRYNRNLVFGYGQPASNYYKIKDYRWSYLHQPNIKSQSIFKVNAIAVQENQIYTDYGFSSRMNSLIDVFGFDYRSGKDADISTTLTSFLNASRQSLYDAGIMINRVRANTSDNISNQQPHIGVYPFHKDGGEIAKKYPFGFRYGAVGDYNSDSNPNNSLLQIVTNPSMRTMPYIGLVRDRVGRYGDQSDSYPGYLRMSDSGKMEVYDIDDYKSLHNSIVNLCKYRNEDEYMSIELARFNIINEQYKIIAFNDVTDKISKGVNPNLVPDSFINESSNLEAFAHRQVMLKEGVQYTLSANGNAKNAKNGKRLRVIIYNNNLSPRLEEYLDITTSENSISSVTFMGREGLATIATFYSDHTEPRDGSVTINWYKLEEGDTFTGYNKAQDDHKYYKGDVFSQKTFMRAIRWSGLPEIMTTPGKIWDWSHSWKFGQAIYIYLQSFTNTYLRLADHDSIYYPYNKRFFTTDKEAIDSFVWRNESKRYMKESWRTNDGYNVTSGLIKLYGYDELLMKSGNELPNRIYVSSTHVGGALIDQYRHIPAGQYMDYNFVGGDILALANFKDYLFSIQKTAIIQHFLGDRLIESDDSSSIIVGTQGLLNKQFRQLESYGTQHKESVVNGLMGVYGVDWDREKIWRIKREYGAEGQVYFVTENLIDSTNAYDLFKFIKKNYSGDTLPQEIYPVSSIDAKGIISTYDDDNKQIQFTFHLGTKENKHEYYTLVFNEEQNAFVGFLSYDASFYMNRSGKVLSFAYGQGNSLYEHSTGSHLHMYEKVQPMELEFVINGVAEENNAGTFEKEFHSHLINASHEEFDLVEWSTEWQSSSKNPFVSSDGSMFWADPYYKEHIWTVPIMNDSSSNKGPLGSNNFSTFEADSKMRGQWLKVKLKYVPKKVGNEYKDVQFYIKNVITNFIISFT